MGKKSKWQTQVWKVIVGLSVILGIIGSILQISGTVDFVNLLALPLYAFFTTAIPIYYAVLFTIVCFAFYFMIRFRKGRRGCILDFDYGRRIAILCQTPRTTDFLRQQYDHLEGQSSWVIVGGYHFDDYMKRLEREGYLEYVDGNWQVTNKALAYIAKYHGR